MKKLLKPLMLLTTVMYLASCSVIVPVAVSNNTIGSKTGKSETVVVFGTLYLNKNYGIADACKKGKITGKVAIVDEKTTNFVFFQKLEMIVTGE
jgi:TRL-like protein family